MRKRRRFDWPLLACLMGGALGVTFIAGCPPTGGDPNEPNTPPPAAKTMIEGTVTNGANGAAMADVPVMLDPAVAGVELMTDAAGQYSAEVPADLYNVAVETENFAPFAKLVEVDKDQTLTVDIALTPTVPVLLSVTVDGDAAPGATVTATVDVEVLDGATTVTGYEWTQSNSVDATLAGATTATTTVTLPPLADFKEELLHVLMEPPITEAQLPPNVPVPATEDGEFPAGLLERFYRPGMSPFALEEAGHVGLMVTVSTSSGDYTAMADIHAHLPWDWSQGLLNIPVGETIMLHGKTQDTYDWDLDAPSGASASLADATSQNPYFTADKAGVYTLTVTDDSDPNNPGVDVEMEIHAGEWQGVITGQDADGRPLAANCTICHNGTFTSNPFEEWAQTGHAEIFTDQLNTGGHYATYCLPCHTVGYAPDKDNGGIDDANDYEDFLAEFTDGAGHFHPDPGNWDKALAEFEDTAQLGNIQCENCHGPNGTALHFNEEFDAARISLSSDVCGTCHGEPLRHARFQQWQLSGHSNYELAIDESSSGNCSRCHTANGFLAWLPVLLDDDPNTDPQDNVTVTWTPDEAHAQTCVVCHDPHDIGTTTGTGTNATTRISGDTPPLASGFAVGGAGNGAICMTCHNTRRGLRNDNTYADTGSDRSRAPHGGAQTDVLVGQNAYFVTTGIRGSHSLIEDSCVDCHMTRTLPPTDLAYNMGGTNHTFFASPDVCADCHGEVVTASGVTGAVEGDMGILKGLIEEALFELLDGRVDGLGNTVDFNGEVTLADIADLDGVEFGEYHGRQAITVTIAGTEYGPFRMNDVDVLDGGSSIGELYDFADDDLIKAGWNYNLVGNDGSHGVHNPSFVFEVLGASIDAMTELLD